MLFSPVRSYFGLTVVYLLVLWTLLFEVHCKSYQTRDARTLNKTTSDERNGLFTQKKPRSAQLGFIPQYQTVYSRQSVPVRLSSVPETSYRLPRVQRIGNVGSLSRLPALQRTYIPVVASSLPAVRYPGVLQQDNIGAGRYVLPYVLKMGPSSRQATEGMDNQEFAKHYNEKYNTLPSLTSSDHDEVTTSLGGKEETKKMDLDDEFDHFLDSLDGPCSRNPCKNGAKCRISRERNSFFCICRRGFKGKTCQDKNSCYPNPCNNEGECTLTSEGFECSCPKGFKGKRCEQQNKCEPNPCENDGICNEIKNGEFQCTCKKGFFGEKCQVTKKGCNPNPCLHDGHCLEHEHGDYECSCAEGYTGKTCDMADNKCIINPCKNGGSCLQAMTSLGYECSCPHGFRGNNCEDHSGCDLNSCQNGGTCYETEFGVRCICKNGYSGDKCQVRRFCEADTCQNNGKCVEHVKGFRCMCSPGYMGKMCEEMDRCHPNPCLHGAKCEQSAETGYLCKCTSQYQGANCEVQNPCSQNPCKNSGKCSSNINGIDYQCECYGGYHGKNCKERNACESNPCENNGVCRRNGNAFLCECQEGFHGKNCQMKDPCRDNPCQNGGSCKKSGDTDFTCLCPEDFKGSYCEVTNPCRDNPCQNGGSCKKSGDTDFTCLCPEDFKGSHCEARKHCYPSPCVNDGICEETNDDFSCSCRAGFRGKKCEEQDQCTLNNPCKNGGRCISLSASYNAKGFTCECVNSFYGDTCEERDPCHPNPCANTGQCSEVNGGFTCQCIAGFKGDRCHEIDKCNPSPCQHGGICSEIIGGLGYACRCAYGYKGQDCQQKEYCHPNPCDHDGQCVASDEGFQCKCTSGFRGPRCSDVNPCEPNPCEHESQCIILPGFGQNHVCNCSIGWSGDTCQKREMCKPNPCQFGTKCVETGDDSYSCVKSMCHPNPCQNSGRCINVNEKNFQCACSNDYEGKICEGDNVSTDLGDNTNDGASLGTKSGTKPETTNIDNLVNLVDATLTTYNSKHSHSNTKDRVDQVTPLLYQVNTNSNKPTKQLDNDVNTNTNDHFTTNNDATTKRYNISDDAKRDVDATTDLLELSNDLVKSINPEGEVVVDKTRLSTTHSETGSSNNALLSGVGLGDRQHKLRTETDVKQKDLGDSILYEIQDEETFIKSINPEGQVVINNGKEAPKRRPNQLSYVPSTPPSIYSQLPGVARDQSNPNPVQVNVPGEKPPRIPMSAIASCSQSLCQNGGVCVQEQGRPIRCKCKTSFTGDTCENSKCTRNPCGNGGMCVPVEREPGFVCKCRDGLTGPLCSRKPCEPNPCKNGADCITFYSVYLCKCKPGFEGKHCEGNTSKFQSLLKTEEKPTTQSNTSEDKKVSVCDPSPCKNNARCLESSDGDFQCLCSKEFSGPRCEDQGMYKYSSAPKYFPGENEECRHCDKNANCVNGHCICRNKFVGDGLECWKQTQRDQQWSCDRDPCQNGGTCKPGISRCVCRLGYVGDYCEEYSPPVVRLKFDKLIDGHKLVDATGNGNDAIVLNGFQIASKQGKCDNAGNMLGGDVLFDGQTFNGIPRRAITISVWIKLTTSLGIQSIFDTIGSHSAHKDGQYHFEIDNGRVRWFHRNEMGKTVFSVITDQPVINKSNWALITGTYSSKKNRARIFINGDLMKEKSERGMLLSGDWGAKAGIATLTEVDVPINDDNDDNKHGVNNNIENNIDKNSLITQSLNNNDDENNNNDENSIIFRSVNNDNNSTISRRDFNHSYSKHEHPYGARILRGMVDEFSIFPSELSRLQIIVLMKHCKVYYHQIKQTSETESLNNELHEPFTQLPTSAYAPVLNLAQSMTTDTRYPGYVPTSLRPLQFSNYYSNTVGTPASTGYQRTETLKPLVVPHYTPGSLRTTGHSEYKTQETPNRPALSPYVQVHNNTATPTQAGYPKKYTPESPSLSQYAPELSGIPAEAGYVKTHTPKGPVVNQYASGWTNMRNQDQEGSVRAQMPHSNVPSYNGYTTLPNQQPSTYYSTLPSPSGSSPGRQYDVTGTGSTSQETGSIRSGQYSAQVNTPNQRHNAYYLTPQTPAGSSGGKYDVSGGTSQTPGSVRSEEYSTQGSYVADKTVPYQAPQTNTASRGVKYNSVLQTDQYQTIVPAHKGQGDQYESPQSNRINNEYQSGAAKGIIPGNYYQSGSETLWSAGNSAPMTSSTNVRSTSYASGLPQSTYASTDVYPHEDNSHQSDGNNGYKVSSYANSREVMPSLTNKENLVAGHYVTSTYPASNIPQYDTSINFYLTPQKEHSNEARKQQLPKPTSQYANQKSQTVHVDNQMLARGQVGGSIQNVGTTQSQINGPLYNNNQYNPTYNRQLGNNRQYPSDVQKYQNNAAKSSINNSPTNIHYGPLPRTLDTTGANTASPSSLPSQWPGFTKDGNSQVGSQTAGYNSWSATVQAPMGTDQWNPSVAPNAKISQVGWTTTKDFAQDARYNIPQMTSRNQWGMSNLGESTNQRLASSLALEIPNSQNQRLASDLAVDKPKVYKRTKIAKHGEKS